MIRVERRDRQIKFCTKLSEQAQDVATSTSQRWVALLLRLLGVSALCAIPAVVIPDAWISGIHQWLGLGEFPDQPIAFYLARSLSAMYVLHGVLFVCMSFDVQRYLPVIRTLATCMLVLGVCAIAVDLASGLPAWWVIVEGPFVIVYGVLLIWLLRKGRAA